MKDKAVFFDRDGVLNVDHGNIVIRPGCESQCQHQSEHSRNHRTGRTREPDDQHDIQSIQQQPEGALAARDIQADAESACFWRLI